MVTKSVKPHNTPRHIKPRGRRATEDVYRVDTQLCGHPLTGEEQSAALGAVAESRHVSIQLLPNHHIDEEQDLAGFVFTCAKSESAARIPFPRSMFSCTTLYEVLQPDDTGDECEAEPDAAHADGAEPGGIEGIDIDALCTAVETLLHDPDEQRAVLAALEARCAVLRRAATRFHASDGHEIASAHFLRIINASAHYRAKLCAELRDVLQHAADEPDLSCIAGMPQDTADTWDEEVSAAAFEDQRAWSEAMPAKVGLYHAFVRSQTREHCRHKLFVVVNGHCRRAADAVRNLWLDFREQLTAGELVQTEEMQWLRQTTVRSHGRLAARVARCLGVRLRDMSDSLDPLRRTIAIPDTVTFAHDCSVQGEQVLFTNNAALACETDNGLLLEVFPNEGFWVFRGPADPSGANAFGIEFSQRRQAVALPVNTLRVPHGRVPPRGVSTVLVEPARLPANICVGRAALEEDGEAEPAPPFTQQFPDEGFMACMSRLGFERDDGVLHLMPLLVYCE